MSFVHYYSKIISSAGIKFNLAECISTFLAKSFKNGTIYQNLTVKSGVGGLKTAYRMVKLSYVNVGTQMLGVLTHLMNVSLQTRRFEL